MNTPRSAEEARSIARQLAVEIEALYLTVRDRIDQQMEVEVSLGRFNWAVRRDLVLATWLLRQHAELRAALGDDGEAEPEAPGC